MRNSWIIFMIALVIVSCLPQVERHLDELPTPTPSATPHPTATAQPVATPDQSACEREVDELRSEVSRLRANQYVEWCECSYDYD